MHNVAPGTPRVLHDAAAYCSALAPSRRIASDVAMQFTGIDVGPFTRVAVTVALMLVFAFCT